MTRESELEIEALRDGNEVLGSALHEAEAKLAMLRDLLREAAEALKPFGGFAEVYTSGEWRRTLKAAHLRRASTVLAKIEEALR